MRPEEMKAALAKMIDDFWRKGDVNAAYEIYSDDIVFHRVPLPPVVGKEANMEADAGMLVAFTENRTTIDEMIVDGDTAAMRWTWEAVHTGTSPSLGIPATGKRVRSVGCSVFNFRDGKVAEQWEYSDFHGLLQQLGVIPPMGG
jgi:steroid delta-isomerase-like uncharacterized protein